MTPAALCTRDQQQCGRRWDSGHCVSDPELTMGSASGPVAGVMLQKQHSAPRRSCLFVTQIWAIHQHRMGINRF